MGKTNKIMNLNDKQFLQMVNDLSLIFIPITILCAYAGFFVDAQKCDKKWVTNNAQLRHY